MNPIELIVQPKNGSIDLRIPVPKEWNGKQVKAIITFKDFTETSEDLREIHVHLVCIN